MMTVDDRGIPLALSEAPKRIVSLVPSLTETLVDLGAEDRIVGLTKFCVHPEHLRRERKRIGGTKGVHVGDIMDLQPDVVIANLEENEAQDVMALEIAGIPCWVCDVRSVERAFRLLSDLGRLVGCEQEGAALEREVRESWLQHREDVRIDAHKVAYAVWRNPWMWAGSDAYIQDVLRWWGWSPWPDEPRYPKYDLDDLIRASIEEVFLPSEPFPFKAEHAKECGPLSTRLVDGEMFSWYGSRMRRVPAYLKETFLAHPK
jgi:ABC-type Fe3+-hydroxamate transport system substrate-binding protein